MVGLILDTCRPTTGLKIKPIKLNFWVLYDWGELLPIFLFNRLESAHGKIETKIVIEVFHRYSLAVHSKKVRALTDGLVPAVLALSEPERKLLTIRINRAKGSHIAIKMHDVVTSLYEEHGIPKVEIARGIGATQGEVDLLLMEGVFQKLNIKDHQYSKAWYPK